MEPTLHLLAEQTEDIGCPVATAYRYATNMERFGDWFPGVLSIASANDGPHATVGKEYRETAHIPLRGERKIRVVVREARMNEFFATEGHLPPLFPRMEISFEATGANSCRITWRMFSRSKSSIARFTLLPLARATLAKRAAAGMSSLKRILEDRALEV